MQIEQDFPIPPVIQSFHSDRLAMSEETLITVLEKMSRHCKLKYMFSQILTSKDKDSTVTNEQNVKVETGLNCLKAVTRGMELRSV